MPDPEWVLAANQPSFSSLENKQKKRANSKSKTAAKPAEKEPVSKKTKLVEVPVYDEENSPSSNTSSIGSRSITSHLAKFAAKQEAGQFWM